jgi:hypothetical protein
MKPIARLVLHRSARSVVTARREPFPEKPRKNERRREKLASFLITAAVLVQTLNPTAGG